MILVAVVACGRPASAPQLTSRPQPAAVARTKMQPLPFDRDVVLGGDAAAYRNGSGKVRIVRLVDGATLDVEAPPGAVSAIAWERDTSQWRVGVVTREPLDAQEIAIVKRSGDLVPIDRKASRARVLRFDANGRPTDSTVLAWAPGFLSLLAIDPRGALVRQPSPELSCGGAPAHDEVRLAPNSDAHRVPGCRITHLVGALARTDRGSVAAVTACSNFDTPDAVQLLAFDQADQPAASPRELLPVTANAFDLRWRDGRLWLVRAVGTRILVEQLGTDARPGVPVLVDDDPAPVHAVSFVGDTLDVIVRRDSVMYRLAVAAALQRGGLPHAAVPTTLPLPPCRPAKRASAVSDGRKK